MRIERTFWSNRCSAVFLWLFLSATGLATTPFGSTFIVKTNGEWHCPGFFTSDLIIADQDRGLRTEIPLKALFARSEYRAHVHDTTAGPLWGFASLPFLLQIEGREYFYMRCWTGKQILLALDPAKLEVPGRHSVQIGEEERKRALSVLTNAISDFQNEKFVNEEQLYGAILIVASRGEKAAKPLLEAIEAIGGGTGAFGFVPDYSYGASWGEERLERTFRIAEVRRFAQLGLRRLGLCPKGYPAIVFGKGQENSVFSPEKRSASVVHLRLGQSSRTVCKLLGPPDYMETAVEEKADEPPIAWHRKWVDAWRYDFESPADFSILVIWSDKGLVDRVEKVTPGLWHGDALFTPRNQDPVFNPDGSINGMHLYSQKFRGKIEELVLDARRHMPQPSGTANRSQPVGWATNRTSSAAGSGG